MPCTLNILHEFPLLDVIYLAEAGYLLLVTSYWLLIRLLVTDSFTGYWFGLLVTDSVYRLLIRFISYCLLIRITGYWFGLLVTGSFTGYWFVYWLLIRFTSYWFGLLVTGSNYWLLIRVTSYWFIYWLLIRLEEFRRNLAYAFLSKSRYVLHMNSFQCLDVSARKWFRSINKYGWTAPSFKIAICTLLNTVTISLSHLLRDHWSDYFETCLSCSLGGLVVSAQKWFRSVDKYGRRQPSLIFSVIASPPKPLEEFSGNLAYEFLSVSRCVCRKIILLRQQIGPNCGNL